jgi:hypothetical protein
MPRGFNDITEAQFHKASRLLNADIAKQLREWWLAVESTTAKTPNIDIASTCMIGNRRGLMLVEAKAHDEELKKEEAGKELRTKPSADSEENHKQIATAIQSACDGLSEATLLNWKLSRDTHYQMSNRFAWSWKLTELGFPVVLVYLGFLRAEEMRDRGNPFADHAEWEQAVKEHSKSLFSPEVWDRKWSVNEQPLIPLIRSLELRVNM